MVWFLSRVLLSSAYAGDYEAHRLEDMAIANRGPELYIVNIVFVTAAILSFSLRIFVRIHMVRAWGRDDWLMVVAMVRDISIRPRAAVINIF